MKAPVDGHARRRGIQPLRILTDNGSCQIAKRFRAVCAELGVRHLRTRPHRPETNGKAERFIQTLLREWAYKRSYHLGHDWLHLRSSVLYRIPASPHFAVIAALRDAGALSVHGLPSGWSAGRSRSSGNRFRKDSSFSA